ncbi:DUF3320 domain-containing protein [Virgibacillus dakarensis]|uniref:DUF3320 domain-containing protein n=1 Tax=Virgibacillus dakarensis TaxID=1917889 RepID=UPI000B43D90F|nr:DUF3320 domain-containing protein [Virgibacillus dakarensis]
MEHFVTCNVEYDKKVSFALQQNHVPVIKYLSIKNVSTEKLVNLTIEITSNPSFSEQKTINLEELRPEEVVELRPDIVLSANYLGNLDESITGHLGIKISSVDKQLYHEHLPIDVLSFDSWPGSTVLPEIISSFITPNRPFIMEIVKQASEIMQKNTGSNAMDGYQSGDPNRVVSQLSAIFSAILSHNIAYANPPASFETEGQKIRFPDLIKTQGLGTCLDLSLLYAACAEAVGIHPIIVFFSNHAFPAFWLKEYAAPESYQDDKSILTKSIAKGINDIILVESTLLTDQNASFNGAVHAAERTLTKPDYFDFFIDIFRSRIGQIKPISIKIESGAKIQAAPLPDEHVKINQNFAFEKVEIIPENDTEQKQPQKNKLIYWQNKLIDMSLRNNLLNYRIYTQGIPVISSSIDQIEDTLAMGKKIFIYSLPNELRNQVRDFRDQKVLLDSQILAEDMKNDRLRSTLTSAGLEKELVKLYRKAKNTLEETGANSLFIALGFLKWFEPKSYTKERFAPILLFPVDLVRMSAQKGYYIRSRDEDVQINISLIEYLKEKFGIDASRLYDIPKDDHGIDVRKVLTTMRRMIMQMKNWDVQEVASIGVFSFSRFVMWNDLVNHAEELKENKVVKSLMNGSYVGDQDDAKMEPITAKKDEETQVYAPLSSDSTQTEAILATSGDNSFVLHGPPGSGKSQTITNMISHALAKGKTVLFVAEKMAALSVVQKRLADIGLADFCLEIYSNKGQKNDILHQLNRAFEIQHKTAGTDWNEKFEEIKLLKKDLNQYVQNLHRPTNIGKSIYEMIETYAGIATPRYLINLDRSQIINMDELTLKRSKQFIENVAVAAKVCGDVSDNPWIGISQTNYALRLQDLVQEQLAAIASTAPKLHLLENTLESFGFMDQIKNHDWYVLLSKLAAYLQDIPKADLRLLNETEFERLLSEMRDTIKLGKQNDQDLAKLEERFDNKILEMNADTLMKELRLAENSWILKKKLGQSKITKELKQYLKAKEKIDADQLENIITTVQAVQENQKELARHEQQMIQYFPDSWSAHDWDIIEKDLDWMNAFRSIILTYNQTPAFLHDIAQQVQQQKNKLQSAEIQQQFTAYTADFDEVMSHWQEIENQLGFKHIHEPTHPDWADYMQQKATALIQALPLLKDNCKLAAVLQEADNFGLQAVTASYLSGDLKDHELLPAFLYGFYRIRIDEEISNNEFLSQFTRASFENEIDHFYKLDDELNELTKLEVYVTLMNRVPNLMNNLIQHSEPGILLKAIKSKGRGIAIRTLFERIQNLLLKIKPCMLMSPLSVAQYLDPSFPKFDLVIFDEASQLPTSEAIGAMGRGKNVVVVGDPKQLPPTSFFNAQQTMEEDFDLQDLESVLDDCLAIRMPQKHLRWHYRSEHESLISFSNNHFYENKLITFPSSDDIHSRVSFRNVGGVYDRGKSKHNKVEAEAVVNEIFTRLKDPERQHESIGVVTFSQIQQTLIEDMIDNRLKQDESLEKYFTDEVPEPVFVKNLENVQGDERDTILFSIGYGPDQNGNVTLNFGPLNRDGGWRRLNVAISRAKREMIIFASMEPDKINLSRSNAQGIHALRAFMEFAKKGNEPLLLDHRNNHRNRDSAVIIPKIQKALENEGYQVERKVGSSDFKVDLAVVDKNNDGMYLAAIQIDGYRYADRITPRDRNKLSDFMLHKLGWHTLHVWSIDWWYDEAKQITSIISKVKELEQQPHAKPRSVAAMQQQTIQEKISTLIIEDHQENTDECIFEPAILDSVSLPNEFFYTYEGMPTIQEQISQVIAQEAPVSFSSLTRSIINAWGFTRSGAKLEAVIQNVLNSLKIYETKEEKGQFLWKDKEQNETYRQFRVKGNYRRTLEDISKFELANGVQQIMRTALRLPKADLVREIAKQLGFNRTTRKTEKILQEAIDLQMERGVVAEDGEGNVVLMK